MSVATQQCFKLPPIILLELLLQIKKCVVVKAAPIHKKDPTQHFSDLIMLSSKEYLKPVFQNKDIDCIRVDGAMDEGPSHELVQYWWTECHFCMEKITTLVTSRSSGSSYVNLLGKLMKPSYVRILILPLMLT